MFRNPKNAVPKMLWVQMLFDEQLYVSLISNRKFLPVSWTKMIDPTSVICPLQSMFGHISMTYVLLFPINGQNRNLFASRGLPFLYLICWNLNLHLLCIKLREECLSRQFSMFFTKWVKLLNIWEDFTSIHQRLIVIRYLFTLWTVFSHNNVHLII